MIVKPHTPLLANDKLQCAGGDAEQQMAFYLRRAFCDPSVHVFHNLRLVGRQL